MCNQMSIDTSILVQMDNGISDTMEKNDGVLYKYLEVFLLVFTFPPNIIFWIRKQH